MKYICNLQCKWRDHFDYLWYAQEVITQDRLGLHYCYDRHI